MSILSPPSPLEDVVGLRIELGSRALFSCVMKALGSEIDGACQHELDDISRVQSNQRGRYSLLCSSRQSGHQRPRSQHIA